MAVASLHFLNLNAHHDRDANVEATVTVAMPYLVFYSAETAFGDKDQLSGVLAVVAFGLTYASPWGRAHIDPHAEHFLHTFWASIGHQVNTVIFVISGLTIALKIEMESEENGSYLAADIGVGLLVYLFLTVCRGLIVFGFRPIFRRGLYGFDWRDALVLTHGGLRGAVGLALALAVASDPMIQECGTGGGGGRGSGSADALSSADSASGSNLLGGASGSASAAAHCVLGAGRIKSVIMLHTCLVVLLTLLVNAPTAKPILRKLGLTKLGDQERSMIIIARDKLRRVEATTLTQMSPAHIHKDGECGWGSGAWSGRAEHAHVPRMIIGLLLFPTPPPPCPSHSSSAPPLSPKPLPLLVVIAQSIGRERRS